MTRLSGPLLGISAALVAPRHLTGERLRQLLEDSAEGTRRGDPHSAIRWAHRALRILARLPRSPWRNTCLYRSVSAGLVLSWLGWPGVVRIGTRRDESSGDVVAHAWVPGYTDEPEPSTPYYVLSSPGRGAP